MSEPSISNSPANSQQIFRKATPEDVIFISRLLREFYAKEGIGAYGIPFDYQSTVVTVDDIVRRGVCLVGPASCAGALISTCPFNANAQIAMVVFWYFQKKHEIAIFKELCIECKNQGATHINPASHFPTNSIGRFYRKCGLKAAETQYLGLLQ